MSPAKGGDPETCAHCGEQLAPAVWTPVVTTTDADGTLQVHSFCDDECKEAWVDDQNEPNQDEGK